MNITVLLIAAILIWMVVIAGTYQRIFQMPKWFANPPASFELMRKQSRNARIFWIPLSVLFIISAVIALILNWKYTDTRIHIIGGLICFALTGILSGLYFVKEIIAFTKISAEASATPDLLRRIKFWLRWTTIRDVLQFFAAMFLSIAYNHI